MRLLTYNILTGGMDDLDMSRWEKIVGVIRSANADLVVLNECNLFELARHRNFHRMERELGMRGLLSLAETGFHVALFVKDARILESRPVCHGFHHAMLEARVEFRGHELQLGIVHMCPFGGQSRVMEAEYLTRLSREEEWVFIAGDMNAISPHDAAHVDPAGWLPRRRARHLLPGSDQLDTRAMQMLERAGLVDLAFRAGINHIPTVQTKLVPDHHHYQVRIDYVFGSPRVARALSHAEVLRGPLADAASDHYAVLVEVDVK